MAAVSKYTAGDDTGQPDRDRGIGLVHSSHPVFKELAAVLTLQFSQAGWDCHVIEDIPAASRDFALVLLFGDVALIPWVDAMLDTARARNIPTLLWQLEPLPPRPLDNRAMATVRKLYPVLRGEGVFRSNRARRLTNRYLSWRLQQRTADVFPPAHAMPDRHRLQLVSRSYQWLHDANREGRLSEILAGIRSGATVLEQAGIRARYVPVGHHPRLGGLRPGVERDLDVVFFGSLSRARAETLRRIERRLGDAGYKLTVISGDCYGEKRTGLLNRARIVVNLLSYPWEFPSTRLIMAMACGSLVVSSPRSDPHPFRDGMHFVQPEPGSLADTLLHYLENEAERERLARQAHAYVTGELTMEKTIVSEIKRLLRTPA